MGRPNPFHATRTAAPPSHVSIQGHPVFPSPTQPVIMTTSLPRQPHCFSVEHSLENLFDLSHKWGLDRSDHTTNRPRDLMVNALPMCIPINIDNLWNSFRDVEASPVESIGRPSLSRWQQGVIPTDPTPPLALASHWLASTCSQEIQVF